MVDLEPGDFVYQANEEIFLVVMETNENNIEFAAHGWRTINRDRLDSYLEADIPVMHTAEEVREVAMSSDDPKAAQKLTWLEDLFAIYAEADIEEDSAHSDFALEDT